MINETLHTLFIAQVMGLYFLITAIIMLSRANYYQPLLSNMKPDHPTIVLGASAGLILGIMIVLVHNIWIFESEVVTTIVAWTILIKSVFWLSFPEMMVRFCHRVYSGPGYWIVAVLTGFLGVFMMSHGFYLFI